MAGYDVTSWYGLSFPAGTPPADRRQDEQGDAGPARAPNVREQILKMGALARTSTPDELKTHIAAEIAKWKGVREKAGIEQEQ